MRHLRRLALLLPLFVPSFLHAQQRNAREEAFVDSLLARMTVEEKLGQLNQLPGIRPQDVALVRAGRVGSFLNIVGADTVHKIQRLAVEQSRLHIPLLFGLDVIHGFRTTFPVPLASAATWDPALVESAERVAAAQV